MVRRRTGLAAGLATLGFLAAGCHPDAISVSPPLPSGQVEEQCAQLGDVLPAKLGSLKSRVVTPVSPLTHAWGKPAITLRCGVGKPPSYRSSSELANVDGVNWFEQIGTTTVTWTALRPGANLALDVPTSYQEQGAFLADLASALKRALP